MEPLRELFEDNGSNVELGEVLFSPDRIGIGDDGVDFSDDEPGEDHVDDLGTVVSDSPDGKSEGEKAEQGKHFLADSFPPTSRRDHFRIEDELATDSGSHIHRHEDSENGERFDGDSQIFECSEYQGKSSQLRDRDDFSLHISKRLCS